jgi:transcriptional regulator with XRE-family HTH domain
MTCVLVEPRGDTRRDRLLRAGRWLTAARERRGLTQRALAAAIERSPQVVSTYERGLVQVPDDTAELLAAALGLSLGETRANLGLYVPEGDGTDDRHMLRLPPGVELTDQQRKSLHRIVDAFIESVRPDDR